MVIHDSEAAVVRRVFDDFLNGVSIRRIAIALSAEAIPSPDGKEQWVLATIGRLLRNEAYVGRLFWNRTHTTYDPQLGRMRQTKRPRSEWITIPVPAIVSDDTFEAAQQAARNNTAFSLRRTEPDTFLLRRLVRCGHCGVKLAAHRAQRDYGMARYYACPHRDPVRAGGAERTCPQRRIRADELDNFVFDQIAQLLARPEILAAGEASVAAQTPAPDDELVAAQLQRIDRRIDTTELERRRLADLYQADVIDHTELSRRAADLQARRSRLDQERQTLIEQRSQLAEHNRLSQHITAFAQRALAGLPTWTSSNANNSCASSSKTSGSTAGKSSCAYESPSTKTHQTIRPPRRAAPPAAGKDARPEAQRQRRQCQVMTVCVPHVNACLTCADFQTTVEFLPTHHHQADQTRRLIAAAEGDGRRRLADNHRVVLGHLERIIDALETLTPGADDDKS